LATPSQQYIYAADLVRRLKQVWKRTRLYVREEQAPPLPPDAVLRRLLDVAYHASLLTEEQRRPSFRIVYCPRSEFKDTPSHRVRSCVRINFWSACPFTEKQLLQLAPATDPTSVMIAVEAAEDTAQANNGAPAAELKIWGLLDTGSSWWEHTRRDSERVVHSPPDLLTISSTRPGQVVISRAWRILLMLENGRLAHPPADVFLRGPIAEEFESPIKDLYEQVYGPDENGSPKSSGSPEADPYEPLLNRHNCSVKYLTCLKRLLTYFMDKSHGGILLMIPDDADAREGFEELVSVKYGCRNYEAWKALLATLELRRRWFEIGSDIARGGDACPKNKVVELSRLRTAVEEQEHQLTDRLHLIAALSGVDGAVVITDKLRLVGFGAELRAKAPVRQVYKALDPLGEHKEPVTPEIFGTRHRSAFRFAADFGKGIAFVHSQDGGMRAVKKVGGEVVYWEVSPPND
jgi:hypothetical protein